MNKSLNIFLSGTALKEARDKKQLKQDDLADLIGYSRQTIVQWEAKKSIKLTEVEAKKVALKLGVSLKDLTYAPDEKTLSIPGAIPFYDAVAVGGTAMLADQTAVSEPTEMINPGTWFKSATGALRVYGHSMFPKYPAGCIVAFKGSKGDIPSVIVWGEDYIIELEDRRILKKIDRGETKDSIKAVSYNINKDNKYVYDPIEIPMTAIKRMYMVLGKVELEASV